MTLRLNGSTSGYTEIDAPAVAGSNTLVLPTGNGSSGQVLSTNGSGALSWANGGKILQVVQTTKTDTFSTNSTTYLDVTGLSVSITPSSSSNKILVQFGLACTAVGGVFSAHARILRDSTAVMVGDAAGSRTRATFMWEGAGESNTPFGAQLLDTPATASSITYKVQMQVNNGSHTSYVNRSVTDTDATTFARTFSYITVMEVAA
jgi:hypothetical protein